VFFSRALSRAGRIDSVIEFGANIGLNLMALTLLFPEQHQSAVEINSRAAEHLREKMGSDNVYETSILEFVPRRTWELVLVRGVLIHVNPKRLDDAYDRLLDACGRFLLVPEYFSRTPATVSYRGHDDRLYKRDFAGELLDRCDDLRLVDYGFTYHRDPRHTWDDENWFLLEIDR